MKKIILSAVVLLLLVFAFMGWRFFGPATAFTGEKYTLYIHSNSSFQQVVDTLQADTVLKSPGFFKWTAARMDLTENVKAGKYEIRKDMSLLNIVRMLRNGRQAPVHLTITKIRTRETLASFIGRKFECDSISVMRYMDNKDSMAALGVDTNTILTIVMPNTYTYFWNTTPSTILRKMYGNSKAWWTPERRQQASARGLTPIEVYILASIIEEETNKQDDKGKIASVYLNRMAHGMKLGADPTVKFALRNFELKRIYDKYLKVESPYNTYRYAGLPPGPICTPSQQTLEAVLTAPRTDYLYFVAKADFSGYSNFAATYTQHLQYAKEYQEALDVEMAIRAKADSVKK